MRFFCVFSGHYLCGLRADAAPGPENPENPRLLRSASRAALHT